MNPTPTLQLFTEVINTRGIHHQLGVKQNVIGRLRYAHKNNLPITIDRMHEILTLAGYQIVQPTLWAETTQKEVKTVQVDYECPKCEVGKLRPTGQKLLSYPPQYPHKCTECDFTETFRGKTYPYITYE